MRAVRGTTAIEGAELTEEEALQIALAAPDKPVLPPNRRRDEQEARNANDLMRFIMASLRQEPSQPLTEALIRRFHELVTQDIDYGKNVPGVFRSHPVSAGVYLPPASGEDVSRLMRELVTWLNVGTPSQWDPVIRAVIAHFYVLSIHPFGDGNGRTARGVESFYLYQAGVNARGFYSLANYYYRNRSEYVRLLGHVRFETEGDLTPLIAFALQGLVEELESVHAEVLVQVRIISFRDYARETLLDQGKLGSKVGERLFHLLLGVAGEPVSVENLRGGGHPLARLYRGVGPRTLARDLKFLEEQGLVIRRDDDILANFDAIGQFTAER